MTKPGEGYTETYWLEQFQAARAENERLRAALGKHHRNWAELTSDPKCYVCGEALAGLPK